MKNLKNVICLVWVVCFIASILLTSCSSKSKYYIDNNNDTIAYLLNKDGSSKTAQIEGYENFLLEKDSVSKCLYNYYGLNGYTTLLSVKLEKEDEVSYKILLNEDSSVKAFYDMISQVITKKRYYPKDSLMLQEILSTLQVQLEEYKVFKEQSDSYPIDYYAMYDKNGLMIYEKDFKEDTLRILDYVPSYIKDEYNSIDYSYKKGKQYILETAKKIRMFGNFAKECINKEEYWESAQIAISTLKKYQHDIFIKLRSKYIDILKNELEKYQINKMIIENDNPYYLPIANRDIKCELYMSADVFISEKTCTKIFNNLKDELYILGINNVIFHWGVFSDDSHIMQTYPKPLNDYEIGL